MNWYTIGSVSFPASWAGTAAAFVCSLGFLYIWRQKKEADIYGNAIFTFLLIWKLSIAIFSFRMVIANPLSLLYFNGGLKGYWLGIAAALVYLLFTEKRLSLPALIHLLLAWVLTVTVYELVTGLLSSTPYWMTVIHFVVNAVFFVLIMIRRNQKVWIVQLFILFICIQGLFLSVNGDLFSIPMATYGVIGIVLCYLMLKRGVFK